MTESAPPDSVAREWVVWAAENLLRGVARGEIEDSLVARGVDAVLASATLDGLVDSPFLEAAVPFVRDARRFAMVAKMHERMERDAASPRSIERIDAPSAEVFFDRYYAAGRPVILRGLLDGWPRERWSFDAMRERFGDAEVMVTVGREDDPLYGATFRRKTEQWPLRTLVDRIRAAESETNDFYLVAQCRALQGALSSMIDDIVFPDGWMAKEKLAAECSLWMGPEGTLTRLHHDFKPLLTCHVRGRKRWRLVPPTERGLLERIRMSHTTLDPETDPMEGILVKDVVVEEGEAIFLPVGWWHHVRALEPAITVSVAAWPREETEHRYLHLGRR